MSALSLLTPIWRERTVGMETSSRFTAGSKRLTERRRKLIELDPLNPLWKLEQGFDSYYEGDFSTAEQRFQKLLTADPNYAGAHSGLSRIYAVTAVTGRFNEAMPQVQQAVALRTGDAAGAEALARALRFAYASRGERGYWETLL
jgi:Flp pilus assembly protein TadD